MSNIEETKKNIEYWENEVQEALKENNIKLPKDRKEILKCMTREEKINYILDKILINKSYFDSYTDKQLDDYILNYTSPNIL